MELLSNLVSLFSRKATPQSVSLGPAGQTLVQFAAAAARYDAATASSSDCTKTYDLLLKTVLMGNSGAGKSSLLRRFTDDTFTSAYCSTIGVDFATRTLSFGGSVVKLQIFDTSGQERFRSITSSYYRGAACVVLVYSVAEQSTFDELGRWLDDVKRYCAAGVAVMVVAAKCDLPAVVREDTARAWAEQNGCLFAVTSAKQGMGVFDAFCALARAAHASLSGPATSSGDKAAAAKAQQSSSLRVQLCRLSDPLALVTGEPLRCGGCGAMFNCLSRVVSAADAIKSRGDTRLKTVELAPPIHPSLEALCGRAVVGSGNDNNNNAGLLVWECDFCSRANRVDASEPELTEFQRGATMDFLVRPASKTDEAAAEGGRTTVFVVDTSGSMSVSEAVAGHQVPQRARDKRRAEFGELVQRGEGLGGMGERGAGSHMSRLELLQAAVEQAVHEVYAKDAGARVGIIAFASDVLLLGGAEGPVTVAGDKLSSFEALNDIVWSPVARPKADVLRDLYGLTESGQTALGPALLLAVRSVPFGGTVTLCTDGLANVGVGRLDDAAFLEDSRQQLLEMGEQCRLGGVTTNLFALGDEGVGLATLAIVAEQSHGKVVRIGPTELRLAGGGGGGGEAVIASQVLTMAVLPRGMRFVGEADDEQESRHWLVKDCGVVHDRSDAATFAFGFRPKSEHDLSGVARLPFQVQVLFSLADGSQVVRVVTASLTLSETGAAADAEVVAKSAADRIAGLCRQARLSEAAEEVRSAKTALAGTRLAGAFADVERAIAAGNAHSDEMAAQLSRLQHASFSAK